MKNIQNKKSRIYGTIGMIGLFLIGGIVGYIINGSDHINHSNMSKYDCNQLAGRIINAANNNQPDLIEQLNKVYSENCLNRVFEEPKPQPKVEGKKLPEETCSAIEELLRQKLNKDNSTDPWDHEQNANIFYKMADSGCAKHSEHYKELAVREKQIAQALTQEEFQGVDSNESDSACEKIENTLKRRLGCFDSYHYCDDPNQHIRDAKVYANLSERGCPENSQKYRDLAKQEIDIARALTDDNIEQNYGESVEIVETYKRLQMQKEAERMIEKAKKLTNPAIDFIIQLEKIIEE